MFSAFIERTSWGRALVAALLTAGLGAAAPLPAVAGGVVAVQAGTIHTVAGETITGGGTILVEDGKITAVGKSVTIPIGARVVDYGADAVIVPGLIDANSNLGVSSASPRTAAPEVRAIDNIDFFSTSGLYSAAGGVTTVYTAPTRGRLIGGQGAVVKLHGEGPAARTLSESAALHGAISAEARSVIGFWEPPVPATVDVGMGSPIAQLPRTTMGAILGLRELLALAREGRGADQYGPTAGPALATMLAAGTPWRIDAQSAGEIRALLRLAGNEKLPLIIETQSDAIAEFVDQLKALDVAVVYEVAYRPESGPKDRPSERVAPRPTFAAPAALAKAGVRFAIATEDSASSRHLLFVAALASRGGLAPDAALRAVTLDAATVLGVADRVGSIAPGKDADFCVLNGHPFQGPAAVLSTWSGGDSAYSASESSSTVVVAVEELHVGDGAILRPGELLIQDGKIAEVGTRVSRPLGARVMRGAAAMPGMIDARGHLGLVGARKTPSPDFKLSRLVGPGDATDREVARAGVTTVLMAPRGDNGAGAPFLAYKPAASSFDHMIVEEAAAVAFNWSNSNRQKAGDNVRGVVGKAVEYDQKWREYDAAIKAWVEPAAADEDDKEKDDDKEKKKDDDKEKEEGDDKKKDDDKKKKKKDDDDEDEEADLDPVNGVWKAKLPEPVVEPSEAENAQSEGDAEGQDEDGDDGGEEEEEEEEKPKKKKKSKKDDEPEDWDSLPGIPLEMSLVHEDGLVQGRLRCALFSENLVRLQGTFEDGELELEGLTSGGVWIDLTGKPDKNELKAAAMVGGNAYEFEAKRFEQEVRRGRRPERRKIKVPKVREPRGKPREPGVDEKLEPIRRALHGEVALVISVNAGDQILECVEYFEGLGVKPVLYGASDAWKLTDELQGRVAGVLLSAQVLRRESRGGFESEVNRYAVLDSAGIDIAFHSLAESGAADLPLMASYAVSQGLSLEGALRALTSGAAKMMAIDERVGRLAVGLDADVLLLDGTPLAPATSVLRAWVAGEEIP